MARRYGVTNWTDVTRALGGALAAMVVMKLVVGGDWKDVAVTWLGIALLSVGARLWLGRPAPTARSAVAPSLLLLLGIVAVAVRDGLPITLPEAIGAGAAGVGVVVGIGLATRTWRSAAGDRGQA